ncbi:ABC transporter substrate-binding protein [Halarsenatibacter silvermanii]|uniref:Peptide/nickel transport system substrate-binding protein n=1 Tax=Halarsenatibacter silvermanii TaxID=321763 RepID=A0A1G9N197_9FIRM|nr:ABC transporter substrate-binding protein [Halarsenatibacter silvermanii]SDL80173.1 peptide/nickel transport system substrate-binding protein [Halarsenatibacter silvermanii]
MMKNLRYVIIAILVLLLAAGAFGSDEAAAMDNSTLRIATLDHTQTLDPPYLNTLWNDGNIMFDIFDGLVQYKPGTFEIEPGLATDWEISDDNREITFYLREGVQFHGDYGEFTAEDVKFSFERIAEDDTVPDHEQFLYLEEVEVVDDYTAVLHLEEPMAQLFTTSLPYNAGLIVSSKAVEEMGRENFAQNPIGTGPYKFESWEEDIVLSRNENYWDQEAFVEGSPERVVYTPMSDAFARGSAVQTAEIDIAETSLDMKDSLEAETGVDVKITEGRGYWWINFTADKEPMDDINLRKALRYIISPDDIIAGAFAGLAERVDTMLASEYVGYWEDAPAYDVEDVGENHIWQLLEEAGYPEGEGLELSMRTGTSDERRLTAEIVQDQLADWNIEASIETMEMGALIDSAQEGTHHLGVDVFTTTPDPVYNTQWFQSGHHWNFFQWGSEEYDELWQELSRTIAEEKQQEIAVEMQKILDEEVLATWLTYGAKVWGLSENVEEMTIQPDNIIIIPHRTSMTEF